MRRVLPIIMFVGVLGGLSACAGSRDPYIGTGWGQERPAAEVENRAESLVGKVATCRFGGTPTLREDHDLTHEIYGSTEDDFESQRYRASNDYRNDCTTVRGEPR